MKKIIFGLIILLPLVMSCKEDESKVIQTNLTIEANQLFSATSSMSESLFFAFYGWDNYQNLDSLILPGCPEILVNESLKQVTLNFFISTNCLLAEEYGRAGQIQLQYDTISSSPDSTVILKYNDYEYESNYLEGTRYFTQVDSANVKESFEEVILYSPENDLTGHLSGEMAHHLDYVNDSLSTIASIGEIRGINPAGRAFDINWISPKIQKMSCFRINKMQPSSGQENWEVERGQNSNVTYSVNYEPTITCETNAYAILPDGRKLLLNPSEGEEE